MKHNIRIAEMDGSYVFQLWYKGKQPMGFSCQYNSYEECVQGIRAFKEYLNLYKPTVENGGARVIKNDNGKYKYQFYNTNDELIYFSRDIEAKRGCINSMYSTTKNFIHAEISTS